MFKGTMFKLKLNECNECMSRDLLLFPFISFFFIIDFWRSSPTWEGKFSRVEWGYASQCHLRLKSAFFSWKVQVVFLWMTATMKQGTEMSLLQKTEIMKWCCARERLTKIVFGLREDISKHTFMAAEMRTLLSLTQKN